MRGKDISFQKSTSKQHIDRVLSYMDESMYKYRDQWSIKKNYNRDYKRLDVGEMMRFGAYDNE